MKVKLLLICLIVIVPAAVNVWADAGHGGTVDESTNLTAVVPAGNFVTGAYLNVTIMDTNKNEAAQIDFPTGIDTVNGPIFTPAKKVIGIQYNNVQAGNPEMGLLLYTDNKALDASYRYTGTGTPAGLVREDGKDAVPLIYSVYDKFRSDTTNGIGLAGWDETPLLPQSWDPGEASANTYAWTNKNTSDVAGYFKYLQDVGTSTYSWSGVGRYECVVAATNAATASFNKAGCAPAKGDIQSTAAWSDEGNWIKFRSPFGGWILGDNYDTDWNYGTSDGKTDCVVYLAGGFKGKAIANYRTTKLIVEVYHKP